jgi:hypothetical protein
MEKMRRVLMCAIILLLPLAAAPQVYNTAGTLGVKNFSLTAVPVFLIDRAVYPGFYGMFGVGITRSIDLSVNTRLAENRSYFGADIEFGLLKGLPSFSLTGGVHGFRTAGIDLTANLTFPIRRVAAIYGGVDTDIEFSKDDVRVPVWPFIGVEVSPGRRIKVIMEIDIGVTPPAPHIIGLGLAFFF